MRILGTNSCKSDSSMLAAYSENLGAAVMRRKTAIALRAAKVEAELASKTKSEFIANMSHELRTPLNAIIGFSDMMLSMSDIPPEKVAQYSGHIKEAAEHLLGLINSILDASKVQAGKLAVDPAEMDIEELIEGCQMIIMPRAREKRLLVEWKPSGELPLIMADHMRIKQVLINLLSNAVKFTPEGGRITIHSELIDDGKAVRITVEDTGEGMSPEEIDVAMRPFGQVNNRLNKTNEGTGLGLPLSAALVRLHDGKLGIESEKGKGAKVFFTLPVKGPGQKPGRN